MGEFLLRLHQANKGENRIVELRVNGLITAPEVRVIAPDGAQVGIQKVAEALWLAEELGLDLVEVAPAAEPPVCRLMDYGKYKYEQSVRTREQRKKQSRTAIKEVRIRPRIEAHDLAMQARKIIDFLGNGDRVKVTLRFRGREQDRPQLGLDILAELAELVNEAGMVENPPTLEDRNITMLLVPRPKAKTDTTSTEAAQNDSKQTQSSPPEQKKQPNKKPRNQPNDQTDSETTMTDNEESSETKTVEPEPSEIGS